jgi:hypothetical protein
MPKAANADPTLKAACAWRAAAGDVPHTAYTPVSHHV